MIQDIYLYFSDDLGSYTKASTQTADQLVTVTDGAPFANMPVSAISLAQAQAGEGFIHNGMVKLTLDAAHNDGSGDVHLFGTHYGTVAQDAVFGLTQSSDAGENGFKLHLLKPYAADQALIKPASQLLNIEAVDATNTLLTFKPTTGDTGAQDKVTLTHTSNKHHLLAKSIADVLTDSRNQGKVIKFADAFNEIYFDGNPAGISAVTFAIDS